MIQNQINNFDIVRNAVNDFQDKTGKVVYLSKFKFGYFTGALDFAKPEDFDRIMRDLDSELMKTEVKQ